MRFVLIAVLLFVPAVAPLRAAEPPTIAYDCSKDVDGDPLDAADRTSCRESEGEDLAWLRGQSITPKLMTFCAAYAAYVDGGYWAVRQCVEQEWHKARVRRVVSTYDFARSCRRRAAGSRVVIDACIRVEQSAKEALERPVSEGEPARFEACYAQGQEAGGSILRYLNCMEGN